ncbi:MAG TPA: hypothetical protein VII11_01860 [Bacteroidota bacterium]
MPEKQSAVEQAIEYGIDITLLVENLKLNHTQRLEKLQQLFDFSIELKKAGSKLHGQLAVSDTISGYNKNSG